MSGSILSGVLSVGDSVWWILSREDSDPGLSSPSHIFRGGMLSTKQCCSTHGALVNDINDSQSSVATLFNVW